MTGRLQRILLVEDDPDIAILTQMALGELGGFDVVHCDTGGAALTRVPLEQPDLLILDFTLPDMTGAEVLTELRSRQATAAIPAIFMTASVMPEHVERLKQLGALDVFAKPFDPLTLPDRVRSVWTAARDDKGGEAQ